MPTTPDARRGLDHRASIRTLIEQGQLQFGLFDERNPIELTSSEYGISAMRIAINPLIRQGV